MYEKHMVKAEAWRDFIAEAPTYELEVYSGVPYYLNIEDILVQGAVSLDGISPIPDPSTQFDSQGRPLGEPFLYTVDETPMRGWRYSPSIVAEPLRAAVERSRDLKSFVITSEQGYTGEDCFNYILSNGKQPSYFGKIVLTVLPWYELEVEVQFDPDTNRYRFIAGVKVPPDADDPIFYRYSWYYRGPNDHDGDGDLNRGRYRKFHWTYYRTYYRGYTSIINPGNDTGWFEVETDAVAAGAKDLQTGLPYAVLDKLQEIEIQVDLFLEGTTTYPKFNGKVYTITKKLSDLLHVDPWYKSGLIEDISVPTLGQSLGEERPPYVEATGTLSYPVDDPFVPDVDSPA